MQYQTLYSFRKTNLNIRDRIVKDINSINTVTELKIFNLVQKMQMNEITLMNIKNVSKQDSILGLNFKPKCQRGNRPPEGERESHLSHMKP